MEEKQSIFWPGNGVDVLESSRAPISQVNKCFQRFWILNSYIKYEGPWTTLNKWKIKEEDRKSCVWLRFEWDSSVMSQQRESLFPSVPRRIRRYGLFQHRKQTTFLFLWVLFLKRNLQDFYGATLSRNMKTPVTALFFFFWRKNWVHRKSHFSYLIMRQQSQKAWRLIVNNQVEFCNLH